MRLIKLALVKRISRSGGDTQSFTLMSITCEPLPDSMVKFPPAIRALLK